MDTEKLKALALAAQKGGDIFTMWDRLCVFQAEATPATVLELIAEDERKASRIAELEAEVEQLQADADRYRALRSHVAPRDVSISMTAPVTDIPPNQTIEERIDMLCDLVIEKEKEKA